MNNKKIAVPANTPQACPISDLSINFWIFGSRRMGTQ